MAVDANVTPVDAPYALDEYIKCDAAIKSLKNLYGENIEDGFGIQGKDLTEGWATSNMDIVNAYIRVENVNNVNVAMELGLDVTNMVDQRE